MSPLAILFDWDGVLVNTHNLLTRAYQHTFDALNKPMPTFDIKHQLPGLSLRDFFPKIFEKDTSKAEKIFYNYIEKNHLSFLEKMPGADDLLDRIQTQKIPCALVSNKRGDLLRKEVHHLGWNPYFYKAVGSRDCSEDKPSPLIINQALAPLGLSPSKKIWFVGDWLIDLECAQRSGLFSILIHNTQLKEKSPYPFDLYVETCQKLQKILSASTMD